MRPEHHMVRIKTPYWERLERIARTHPSNKFIGRQVSITQLIHAAIRQFCDDAAQPRGRRRNGK